MRSGLRQEKAERAEEKKRAVMKRLLKRRKSTSTERERRDERIKSSRERHARTRTHARRGRTARTRGVAWHAGAVPVTAAASCCRSGRGGGAVSSAAAAGCSFLGRSAAVHFPVLRKGRGRAAVGERVVVGERVRAKGCGDGVQARAAARRETATRTFACAAKFSTKGCLRKRRKRAG